MGYLKYYKDLDNHNSTYMDLLNMVDCRLQGEVMRETSMKGRYGGTENDRHTDRRMRT